MNADVLLDAARTATLAVDQNGIVLAARGGFGGFPGIDLAAAVGTSVFDRLTPSDADELATYFIENAGEADDTVALPVPFRAGVFDDAGRSHLIDIIASGWSSPGGERYWIVVLVPVALSASVTRSLDLEMAGADRATVKRMLCEELEIDNVDYESRWLMIDFTEPAGPAVVHARSEEADLADAVRDDLREGWRPWHGVPSGECAPIDPALFPARMQAVMGERGWRRVIAAPVHVNGRLAAVLLLVGRVPESYPLGVVKRNLVVRTHGLVKATTLLFERWAEQDHLRSAATSDALTGLGNSRALTAALADTQRAGAVLFIDIDHFKAVNDRYGHQIGDAVLIEVAERLVAACRHGDVVTRFGGDEFVILLEGADETLAAAIGWRIIDSISAPLGIPDGPETISVSVGLAPRHGLDALDVADRAMLEAKRAGRSRLATITAP